MPDISMTASCLTDPRMAPTYPFPLTFSKTEVTEDGELHYSFDQQNPNKTYFAVYVNPETGLWRLVEGPRPGLAVTQNFSDLEIGKKQQINYSQHSLGSWHDGAYSRSIHLLNETVLLLPGEVKGAAAIKASAESYVGIDEKNPPEKMTLIISDPMCRFEDGFDPSWSD